MAKYDIFISYRREGGYDTAKHLYDLLTRDGYRVSFDIDTLRNGDFDKSLLNRIEESKDFILIVDAHAFDRTLDPNFNPQNDWLRQELSYALNRNKNIVPIFLNDTKGFPENLPSDLKGVSKKNGPEYNRYYFNDFYNALKDRFLTSKPSKRLYFGFVSILIGIIIFVGMLLVIPGTSERIGNYFWSKSLSLDSINLNKDDKFNKDNLDSFCGYFSHVETQSIMWDLELDPQNRRINLELNDLFENVEDLSNELGYMGTFFRQPSLWVVNTFNVASDGKSAMINLIMLHQEETVYPETIPDLAHCNLKLALDEYNNIIATFESGTYIPWIMGTIENNFPVKFTRVY